MTEEVYLLLWFTSCFFLLLCAADKLADWWRKWADRRENNRPVIRRPLPVRKITRKPPPTARPAGVVHPDGRKEPLQ